MFPNLKENRESIKRLKKNLNIDVLIGELEGKNSKYPVYSVSIKYLTLNPLNSRFQVNLSSEENKEDKYYYTSEGQKEIANWIWTQKETINKKTEKDLKEKGQQKPGVITADGLIINGNRRFVIIKKLFQKTGIPAFSKMNVVILKDIFASDTKIIKEKEIRLQFGEDKRLDYSRINTMLTIRDFQISTGWTEKEIKEYFNWSGSISEMKKTLKSIEEYKEYFGIKSYGLVDGMEDQFKYFSNSYTRIANHKNNSTALNWAPKNKDLYEYKCIMFKFLRMKPTQPNLRSIVKFDNEKNYNVFVNENIWKKFKEEIIKIYQKGKEDTNQIFINKGTSNLDPESWNKTFEAKTKKKKDELIIEINSKMLIAFAKKRQEKLLKNLGENITEIENIAYEKSFKESSKKKLIKLADKLWYINNKISVMGNDDN